MNDSPQSSNVIRLRQNSVVPISADEDEPDPTRDPYWILRAAMFYDDDGIGPEQAYEEFYRRDRQHGIAS